MASLHPCRQALLILCACLFIVATPTTAAVKLTPRLKPSPLSTSPKSGSGDKPWSETVPPSALRSVGVRNGEKVSESAFAQHTIVLPALMKMIALVLVPATSSTIKFLAGAVGKTGDGVQRTTVSIATASVRYVRAIPKKVNSILGFVACMFRNTVVALARLTQNTADIVVDFARDIPSWIETCSLCTYHRVLLPAAEHTVEFVSEIANDVVSWTEDATYYSYRFISSISQEAGRKIAQFGRNVWDLTEYVAESAYNFATNAIYYSYKSVFDIVLNIPVWINTFANLMKQYVVEIVAKTKNFGVTVFDDAKTFIQWFIDTVPFLVRYEENGKKKVAFSPRAQFVLYIVSTLGSIQSFTDCIVKSNEKNLIPNVVDTLKTRFFPPRALFCVGALARGFQQSSKLAESFQPTVGVGAMINFGALSLSEKWIVFVVSGWFLSGQVWTLFGSKTPGLV